MNVHEYSVLLCKLVDPCNLLFYLGALAQYLGIILFGSCDGTLFCSEKVGVD